MTVSRGTSITRSTRAVPVLLALLALLALPAAPALALPDEYCYDSRGRALEVPPHFQMRFPGGTHRAPESLLNPGGLNCKPLPMGGNPPLCNRDGVVIAGSMSGNGCVTAAPSGDCYHNGKLIGEVHWNVTNPGLLKTDISIATGHRYYDAGRKDFALGNLRRDDRSGECLPAPSGFCYGSLVEGGTTKHYLMKSVTRTGSYEPTCF